ncbi:hypothetical protein [Enterococcus casseliflavus]|uniref:hypothetical protein n=1 Tax=Enterococcus casseliflavus TaxID=37734 RepID=UPI000763D097|nr:hypothetical protein [Enterococcus casseliflavus]QQU24743.1 transcriptional regulator, BlaI/MecI/CopY family protein [Enterococcus casseliflavus]
MSELRKSEYQVLYYFYEFNQSITKHELLELVPNLNRNTTASVISNLLSKGYLEIGEIKYSKNVLARAYRPCIPLTDFLKDEFGKDIVERIVKHELDILEDQQQLEQLLGLIARRKNTLKEKTRSLLT